ncbi:MAG TPA: serine hydrolase [Bacteroidetes bacterium]|nr:serine hydrolase [Bacteroidota bacterium]
MKKFTFFLLTFLFSTFLFSQKQTADPRLKDLDAALEKVLPTWKAPGFAVAIVDGDQTIYAKGFGYSDYENKIPATAHTLYAIGSCTKAFTASLPGMLRDDGKLELDDSPRKYIPELEFYNDELNSGVTLKDMMCHRTGLPRHDFAWYLFPTPSRDELVRRIAGHEPFGALRQNWYYNNFMYLLLGVVVERITGKSWEENIREKIFGPLGMNTANLSIAALKKSADAARGYETTESGVIKKRDYYEIGAMGPAGSINSSVSEMAEWLKVWIHGGKYGREEILPEKYVQEAITPQMVMRGGAPGKKRPELHFSTYGYGWMCSSYKGHYRVEHGGNIDGFSASACFFPSDSIGIVVLTNQNGSTVPAVVRNIIADRMLGVHRTDWNTELYRETHPADEGKEAKQEEEDANRKAGTSPSHPLSAYTGLYANDGYGQFDIELRADSLFAIFPEKTFWLRHYHYDVFEPLEVKGDSIVDEDSQIRLVFTTNSIGDIDKVAINLEPALDHPIHFKHTPKTIEMEKEALDKYIGQYVLAGIETKIYTKGENLFLFVPGQPEYELLPTGPHTFSLKNIDGYKLKFHEDDSGRVSAVSFIQPNGTFKAMRK